MNQDMQQKSPLDLVNEARLTLGTIQGLVRGENSALTERNAAKNMPLLEAALPEKKKLSLRLERLVHALKKQRETWQDDATVAAAAKAFEADMEAFKSEALNNLTKLRAAHQMRADFIGMVKDTVMKLDASQTYNPNGKISDNTGPVRSVLGKNV